MPAPPVAGTDSPMILRATLATLLLATAAQAAPCPARMPVQGYFSSGFGPRGGGWHSGVDLVAPAGTPVFAAASGTVAFAGTYYAYGLMVEIMHRDGTRARYAHLRSFAPHIRPGATVAAGEQLGAVGRTGRATTAHLHLELRRDGRAVDPWPWLTRTACRGFDEVAEAPARR